MDGREVHFSRRELPFLPIFGLFLTKSARNIEKKWSHPKVNITFGLTTLKYPFEHPFLFIIGKKIFSTWKTLHSHIALIDIEGTGKFHDDASGVA